MAKVKQKQLTNPRYTIQCRACAPEGKLSTKWEAETINQCECGNVKLFADDHHTAKSRWFVNGVMCES